MSENSKTDLKVKTPVFELEVSESIISGCTKPIQDMYGFVGDWIADKRAQVRVERQVRYKVRTAQVLIAAQTRLKEHKISDPKELSDKMLEVAGTAIMVEDDTTLQQMWANLLVKAMDPQNTISDVSLAQLLKEMPAEAARTFSVLVNLDSDSGINLSSNFSYSKKRLIDECKGGEFDYAMGLEHLIRLRIFETVLIPLPQHVPLPIQRRSQGNPEQLAQSLERLEGTLTNLPMSLPGQALQLTLLGQALRTIAVRDTTPVEP